MVKKRLYNIFLTRNISMNFWRRIRPANTRPDKPFLSTSIHYQFVAAVPQMANVRALFPPRSRKRGQSFENDRSSTYFLSYIIWPKSYKKVYQNYVELGLHLLTVFHRVIWLILRRAPTHNQSKFSLTVWRYCIKR